MTIEEKRQEIRKGIEEILIKYKKSLHKETQFAKSSANIDFRDFATQDILRLLDSQGVVIEVEKELPEPQFHPPETVLIRFISDLRKAGWHPTERLI